MPPRPFLQSISDKKTGWFKTYAERHRIAALLSPLLLLAPLPLILALSGSDKEMPGEHSYGDAYRRLFRGRRWRRLKILEVGLLDGDSLVAWRAAFPRAVVVGFDIEDKREFARGARTRIYRGNQSSAADLARVCDAEGPFDIIIDDGSHLTPHQLASFRALFPSLLDGGLYVVEDAQTSFWQQPQVGTQWNGRRISDPAFAETCCGWFLDLARYLNHAEFETLDGLDPEKLELGRRIRRIGFEHNIVAIEKGPNVEPSNIIRRPD